MRGGRRGGLWSEVAKPGERNGSERAQVASVAEGTPARAGVRKTDAAVFVHPVTRVCIGDPMPQSLMIFFPFLPRRALRASTTTFDSFATIR